MYRKFKWQLTLSLQQRFVGAGVEPRHAASESFDVEVAPVAAIEPLDAGDIALLPGGVAALRFALRDDRG